MCEEETSFLCGFLARSNLRNLCLVCVIASLYKANVSVLFTFSFFSPLVFLGERCIGGIVVYVRTEQAEKIE